MTDSIFNNIFSNQIGELANEFVKEMLELIMREEMENFFKVENLDVKNSKNDFYERMVNDGEFRADLYCRINVIQLHIPP